jgi:hypothetical protein
LESTHQRQRSEIVEALVDGLRKAGWSEPATQ